MGSGAEPQRGPGQRPGGVRGSAPAGCGAAPHEENFAYFYSFSSIFQRNFTLLKSTQHMKPFTIKTGNHQCISYHSLVVTSVFVFLPVLLPKESNPISQNNQKVVLFSKKYHSSPGPLYLVKLSLLATALLVLLYTLIYTACALLVQQHFCVTILYFVGVVTLALDL